MFGMCTYYYFFLTINILFVKRKCDAHVCAHAANMKFTLTTNSREDKDDKL